MASENASNQTLNPRYRSVIIGGDQEEQNGHAVDHPLKLLEEIWRDPSIAQYIKYITFINRDPYNFRPSHVDDTVKDLIRDFESADGKRFLSDSVRNTPLSHHQNLWERCLEGVLAGKQTYAFTLLLISLPQLERLRFCCPRWDMELLSTVFTDPNFSSKLSIVECYHDDTEDYISVEDYMIFALIPSVQLLRGRTVGEYGDWSKIPNWTAATSRLVRLELTACAIENEDVKSLLQPMRNLKEFRYYGDYMNICEGPFETQIWVDALAETVGQTLEVLTLMCVEGSTLTVKTFKSFENLRELEIDVRSLVRDAEDDISIPSDTEDDDDDALETGFHQSVAKDPEQLVPRLIDVLPPSIEKVNLFVHGLKDEALLLLRDLVSEKARLPNLKTINLGGQKLEQSIKDELMDVGITVGHTQKAVYPDYALFWESDPPLYDDWLVGRPC